MKRSNRRSFPVLSRAGLLAFAVVALPQVLRAKPLEHAPTVHRAANAASAQYQSALAPDAMLSLQHRNGEAVIVPNGQTLWAPLGSDPEHSLEPNIAVELVADGADITYTFENLSQESKWLGALYVGGIRFGADIRQRLFQADGKETVTSHGGKASFGGGGYYPGDLYSPVATLREGDRTIGVSLLYPVLEYKHTVFIRVESPGGPFTQSGQNWQVLVHLSPLRAQGTSRDIAPGERRTYTLTVRAASGDPEHDWMRTLVPYRDYYVARYGGVRYERDPRPVRGIEIAGTSPPTPSNPRAFAYEDRRIDLQGWQPWIGVMRSLMRDGFQRFMVIAPTGMFEKNRENNYPFQFTSGWRNLPRARQELPLLAQFGKSLGTGGLGLWWGRSVQVMEEWDTPSFSVLSPDNPAQVARATRELDLAALLNTTVIGLDAFSYLPAWDGYRWITAMQERHPGIKFIVEPLGADFLHTIAGTYVYGLRPNAQRAREPGGAFLLADYLNPGHETWARLDANLIRARTGLGAHDAIPPQTVRPFALQLASWGYVPIIHAPADVTGIRAADSWEWSVPSDLRQPSNFEDDSAQPRSSVSNE